MYVPTIAAIVVLRYYLHAGRITVQNAIAGRRLRLLSSALLFVAAQFWGTLAVPQAGLRRSPARAGWPIRRAPTS